MEGTCNTRDLGGLKTEEGRNVRFGRVLRSDRLSSLTPKDIAYFSSLPLRCVLDLRRSNEILKNPDVVVPNCEYYQVPMHDDPEIRIQGRKNHPHEPFLQIPKEERDYFIDGVFYALDPNGDLNHGFEVMYRSLVTYPPSLRSLSTCLQVLKSNKEGAVLFHCSSGKDRTGILAMIFLLALGVKKEDILKDYLKTNPNFKELSDKNYQRWDSYHLSNPVLKESRRLFDQVKENWLKGAYQEIVTRYHSFPDFLNHQLSFSQEDIEELKANYLE